jgi:hypothetical protein
MPSTSKKQHNLMEAVAHNPAFAKKVGIPRSVGEEFSKADKGKTFKKGGIMKMEKGVKPSSMSGDVEKGSNKKLKFGESAVQKKGHTKGRNLGDTGPKESVESEKNMKSFMKKYAKGGKVKRYDDGGDVETETAQGQNKNIGDDTRARAMAALQSGKMDQEVPTPKPRMRAKSKSNAMTDSMSRMNPMGDTYKKGGMTKKMAGGGSASSRADGIAQRGKTRGKYC